MAGLRQCEFFVLRYLPDVVKGEFVNLGVVLMETGGGADGFTDVRFTRDWRRVRCADPEVDIGLLESYENEFRRLLLSLAAEVINYRGPMSRREWLLEQMQQSFSGALMLSSTSAVLTAAPAAELSALAKRYLESSLRGHRLQGGRRVVYNAMRGAFEQAGVWEFMRRQIPAAEYTDAGDPLKIDCAYKADQVLHMFHAVSLASEVDSAKVLGYSYVDMRDRLEDAEHAKCDLTAITENGLDLDDPGIAFALATLAKNDVETASVSELPGIAERARLELKL
jgi:hypothetical protein